MIFEKRLLYIFCVLLPVVSNLLSAAPDVVRIGAFFDTSESEDEVALRQYVDNFNLNTSGLQMAETSLHLELIVERLSPTDVFRSAKRVCRVLQEGVLAVFGPKHPTTASLVHTACSRHQVVHFNWEQNVLKWDDLSFSTAPTPKELGLALKDLIAAQHWTHFTIVYEHPEALFRLKEVLDIGSIAGRRSFHPSVRLRLLPPGSDHRPLLRDIAKHGESNIVLDVSASRLTDILKYAQAVGIFSEYHNYIITTLDLHMVDLTDFQSVGANVTGFQLLNADLWQETKVAENYNKMGIVPLFLRSRWPRPQLKLEAALTQDAHQSLVSGLQTLSHMRSFSHPPPVRCGALSSRPWSYAQHLSAAIRKLSFIGRTGPFHLDGTGRRVNITLHVVQLKRSGLISIGTWNARHGLNISFTYSMVYEEVLQSLRNKTLKITTLINPPYLLLKPSAEMLKGNDRFEGYCVDLIREISNILHFNYEFRLVRDGAYGSRNSKGVWNGMIRELIDREADLAVADLTISYMREEAVDFTMPFMTLGISILFRKSELEQTLLFFLTPLSVDVWVSMAMAYIGISVLLFLVARFSPNEWTSPPPCELIGASGPILKNHFTLLNSLWFTISAIMQQGCDASPRSTSTRIIAAVWWFFSFVIISSYTANLASFLTRERMRSPIESAEDLAKQSEIMYGCVKSGSTEAFFKESKFETYEKIWQTMSNAQPPVLTESNPEGANRVKAGKYAFFMESTSIEYIVERDCELQQIGGLLDSKGYGIATPSGSPYRTHLSSAILQLQEKGTLQELKDRWWKLDAHRSCADDGSQVKAGSASELGLSKVGGVFVVLLAGLGLACIIAFAEFICKTRSMRRPIKVEEET